MITCYIGLGSNLDNPINQVQRAAEALAQLSQTELSQLSPWYRSSPIGPAGQEDYINGVAQIRTQLTPLELLDALQAIESDHQRVRIERWGARTLDLDILLYGDQSIDLPRLQIPHIEMYQRNFVLQPLYDIAPALHFPDDSSLISRLNSCPANGLEQLQQ